MITVGDHSRNRSNNFDAIRLFAAVLVIVSHSYPISGRSEIHLLGYDTVGGFAVAVFFIVSGFLVSKSVEQRTTLDYLAARALRIVPGLIALTLFEVLVVGVAFTTNPIFEFLRDRSTLSHVLDPLIYWNRPSLPGVFSSLPISAVNGSLWTIPLEVTCYLILPVIAALGLLKRPWPLFVVAAVALTLIVETTVYKLSWGNQGGAIASNVPLFSFTRNALFFVIGSAYWVYRDRIALDPGLAICAVVMFVVSSEYELQQVVAYAALPYLVLFVALYRPVSIPALKNLGDCSYGTYLYAFPIQQSLVSLLGTGHPTRITLLAVPIAIAIGVLSWRFVEEPALRRRTRLFPMQTAPAE